MFDGVPREKLHQLAQTMPIDVQHRLADIHQLAYNTNGRLSGWMKPPSEGEHYEYTHMALDDRLTVRQLKAHMPEEDVLGSLASRFKARIPAGARITLNGDHAIIQF